MNTLRLLDRPSGGLDSSGWHSDQGSQNQGIAWEIRLWKNDMERYSTSVCREFRCASSWHSHLIRSTIFGILYQGTLKPLKNHNTYKIHAHKIQGVFFLRSPKRRRQLGHRHKGLGMLKSMNIHANHLYWFNKWQFVVSTSIFWNHQICIRTYPMRGYLLTWYVINPSARGYLLTWYFINPVEREYLLIRLLRLTFWQRFYIHKNYLTNET